MQINKESHKRLFYPDYSRFSSHTTFVDGKWIICNGLNEVLYRFESEEEMIIKSQSMLYLLKNVYWHIEREYLNHKREYPKYYEPSYEEANFTHKAICKGFKPYPEYFNPYDNWFGVSGCAYPNYTPDAILTRGNKSIKLSLQGLLWPLPKVRTEEFDKIAKSGSIKYLAFIQDEELKYETYFGQLPSNEFIEQFISNE